MGTLGNFASFVKWRKIQGSSESFNPATVSGKHRSPDAKKPNPGNRSTFPDYRKKEVIFKFGHFIKSRKTPLSLASHRRGMIKEN